MDVRQLKTKAQSEKTAICINNYTIVAKMQGLGIEPIFLNISGSQYELNIKYIPSLNLKYRK